MSHPDGDRWQAARTLAHLGELTALWLEGSIASHPTYGGLPETETTPLIAVLAACNRAGLVTGNSQPGVPPDERGYAQRAAVYGYTTMADLVALCRHLDSTGVIVVAHAGAGHENSFDVQVVITLDQWEELTWEGARQSRGELAYHYGDWCQRDAVDALASAWQVSLIDPEWGRNDVLWPALEAFAARDRP